jgi:glucose/arabinose dehydrogenase
MRKMYSILPNMKIARGILFMLGFVCSIGATAQPVVTFRLYMSGFAQPVDIVNADDGSNRLFIVERGGTIRIIEDSVVLPTPFLDISDSVITSGGEQGLLSLAFHPLYEENRMFFVYYTRVNGSITVARFFTNPANPYVADETTGNILLTIPKSASNHNGGKLNFGADGYLYFATGDGGGGGDPLNNAQNGNSLLGKMLRLNVDGIDTEPFYTIPEDNPFVDDPNVRDEIWALGLRNPWRWSFDRQTYDLWLADVGQEQWEELNFRPAGATGGINYGWRCYEGFNAYNPTGCQPQSSYVSPIYAYAHNAQGGISVTGGYVYRGDEFPALRGYYLMSDFGSGHLWLVAPDGAGGWNVTRQASVQTNVVSYGESESGRLFAATLNGNIYLVTAPPGAPLPVTLVSFQGQPGDGGVNLSWETSFEQNVKQFEVQYSENNIDFTVVGVVPALNNLNGETYRFTHTVFNKQRVYYRLKTVDLDGAADYSKIITVEITGSARNYVFPTIGTNGTVSLYLSEKFENVEILDLYGRLLRKQMLGGRTGRIDIPLPQSASGAVIVRLNHQDWKKSFSQKVFVR